MGVDADPVGPAPHPLSVKRNLGHGEDGGISTMRQNALAWLKWRGGMRALLTIYWGQGSADRYRLPQPVWIAFASGNQKT